MASSQRALTHLPSAGQSSLAPSLEYICYCQNIELHPGCPAFVQFSESINRKSRELCISAFAFESGHFLSSI